MHKKVSFFLLLLLTLHVGFGQSNTDSSTSFTTKQYLSSYWQNGKQLITQPARWKGKDWAKVGVIAGTTTALFFADKSINNFFDNWNRPAAVTFGKTGDRIGQVPIQVGLSVVSLGIGLISKSENWKNFGEDALQAQLFTGAGTEVTKYLFGRARPINEHGPGYWDGPLKSNGFVSFFSGHTSLAFSTATMIYLHSHKKLWVGLLSYGIASGIGVSRMQISDHWASDVFVGAVVGTAVSTFIYKQNEKKRHPKILSTY